MTRTSARVSALKSEISSHQNDPVLSSSNAQVSDAQVFENEFMASIAKTQQLKSDVQNKFKDYEMKLHSKEIARVSLELTLQKEQDKSRNVQKELTEQIATLTKLNELLFKQNDKVKNELQQCEDKVKSLLHDLNLKQIRLNDLDKDCQKLLKEKTSFSKYFNDRLKVFINDISFSEAGNLEMIPETENTEESVQIQNNKKRLYEVDLEMSLIHDQNSLAKRQKTIDPLNNSSDPNDNSTNNQNDIHELVEESQPDLDAQLTQTNDDRILAKADSTNNSELDCGTMTKDNRVEVIPGSPIHEKRRNLRKNIRRVMNFENLTPETKLAYQQEKERKKQYVQRLQKYNDTYGTLPGELNKLDKLVLDFDLNTKRELLVVDKKLSMKLKPHQCQGVKFMWDACFESIEKLQSSDGSGCILGHCMGLGKTLQVITLVHTLLTHSIKTKVGKVLIICPVNVILNWVDEFQIWLKEFQKKENIKIYELSSCNSGERTERVKSWEKNGGVLIIGYNMFQKMCQDIQQNQSNRDIFQKAFVNPGADLVVCDEGHLLKNPTSLLSLSINKIRTLRRIVLTGTPLQNNLKEYFSMVEFVKPRLLGTEIEFNNRFVGPIVNGQYIDSTDEDIMLMKYRAYILHKLLDGCVQRRDYSVLAEFLPSKQEYVLFIRLTKVQIDLYKYYMKNIVKSKPVGDLPSLRRVCNHPKVLVDFEDRCKREQSKALKNVVNFEKNDSERETDSSELPKSDNESELNESDDQKEWWKPVCSGDKLKLSGKMLIFFSILAECEARDEKLIVFSGCLATLNVIEDFLAISEKMKNSTAFPTKFKGFWTRDVDYFRLDGSINVEKRKRDIATFNKETNKRARLFLISTKAGGLGINLMAANRVVIFDVSWNPSDDIQSMFRTYRIGQKKECFVYRFVGLGTIEEKIYDRQVSKLSTAKRVIDEHQISRHFKEEDLQQLYCVKNLDPPTVKHQASIATKDNLLNALLQKHRDVIFKHHDHDSLLENMTEETLTDQEIGDVWEEFVTSENDNSED